MALGTSQSNRPRLAAIPQALPTTQPLWQQFVNALQGWRKTLGPPTWIAPTLLNSWIIYPNGGFPSPPGYCMDSSGRVHLRGLISSGAISAAVFVLPVGYRPPHEINFPVSSGTGFGAVRIYGTDETTLTPGAVTPFAGSPTWISLDGISFSTTP